MALFVVVGACGDDGEDDAGREDTHEKVDACMDQHEMGQAQTVWRITDESVTYYKSCVWPRVQGTDPDGYTEIKVTARIGPGDSEASGTGNADVIKSMCSELEVEYSNVFGGPEGVELIEEHRPSIRSEPGRVIVYTGEEWPTDSHDPDQLPFDYRPDELVVLRDSRVRLDDVRCGT